MQINLHTRCVGVLRGVGQRLGDHVIGGDLDPLRQPALTAHVQRDGNRRTKGKRLQRRWETTLGQDRGMDAA
jgi:hypothetical protein